MNADKIESAVLRYGTPLYIFDMDILMEELGRFRKNLSPETGLCYAMKANPFVTEQMAAAADRIEVCSMGEFRICRNLRISPERLLISGVLKKKEDILEILDYCGKKSVYTVESPNQFYCFVKWCAEQNQDLSVYLRLTSGNQFGMDEETVIGLIRERKRYPNLKIRGIHYFSGTQKRSLEQIRKELEYLDDFLMMVKKKEQFEIQELEYGPGLAVSYFRGKEKQVCRDDEIKQISGMMEKMKWKGRITLEMGRALAAMCGYYLTEVCDIKQSGNTNYCIVDGGIHQMNYDGQIRGMYMPHVSVWPGTASEGKRKEKSWTVCGALCTVNDVLCRNIRLGEVKTGDVLVFERTGAYSVTEGMSLFLSHDLPKVAFYCERMGWKLVRNRMHSYVFNTPGTDDREYMDEK